PILCRHARENEAVMVGAEAQEHEPLLVGIRHLEAQHPGVEVDHAVEIAAVEADVADLADPDGVDGSITDCAAPCCSRRGRDTGWGRTAACLGGRTRGAARARYA